MMRRRVGSVDKYMVDKYNFFETEYKMTRKMEDEGKSSFLFVFEGDKDNTKIKNERLFFIFFFQFEIFKKRT